MKASTAFGSAGVSASVCTVESSLMSARLRVAKIQIKTVAPKGEKNFQLRTRARLSGHVQHGCSTKQNRDLYADGLTPVFFGDTLIRSRMPA